MKIINNGEISNRGNNNRACGAGSGRNNVHAVKTGNEFDRGKSLFVFDRHWRLRKQRTSRYCTNILLAIFFCNWTRF